MKRVQAVLAGVVLAAVALQAGASDLLKPQKITAKFAAGPVFSDPKAGPDPEDRNATDYAIGFSKDKKMEAGLYKAGASDAPIDSYPVDEFCYFLTGVVTLTSSDGSKVVLHPHEAVFIPKGWKGRWTTRGYTKYYVTYDSK